MCGITGVFNPTYDINVKNYYDSHHLIKHRGPDDEGFFSFNSEEVIYYKGEDTIDYFHDLDDIRTINQSRCLFGQRRLSIIDLSEHGHQPYSHNDFHMVYNGEVYNYIEIREELKLLGYSFLTKTDTEVVLKSYIEWGNSAFNKFNGMWAIAIFDKKKNSVVLSRDRFGIKPLYYSIIDKTLIFSSEIKFIKSFVNNKLSLNSRAIKLFSEHGIVNNNSDSFYEEISELNPASWLSYSESGVEEKRYWNLNIQTINYSKSEALEQFKNLFQESLRLRMRSDVEVGGLLSGGLDSSLILCELFNSKLCKEGNYKAFSAVFEEERFSEKKYVDELNKELAYEQHFVKPKADDLLESMSILLNSIDEPFRTSQLSQFLIYKHVKKNTNVKVLLNGQGADEIFGGYSAHYIHFFTQLLATGKFGKAMSEINLYKKNRGVSSRVLSKPIIRKAIKNIGDTNFFNQNTSRELSEYYLREYLKYDDRTSMAFSLESRVPFLDYKLVEFAFSLPVEFKINKFDNKYLVREYARKNNLVPKKITERKDKMGFVTPQESWQKNELKESFDSTFNCIKKEGLFEFLDSDDIYNTYQRFTKGDTSVWNYIWRTYSLMKWKKEIL